jgi:integrase
VHHVEQYAGVRDALPEELRPLFITAYLTGIRKGELLAITWPQVDFESRLITLEHGETKNKEARSVPIIGGDMFNALWAEKKKHDDLWPRSPWVFSRRGEPIRNFQAAWQAACKMADVPELHFHDLRRTAVRNMRRAGIPQVIRMKISGHKTDSMERRYNIVDSEDLVNARELLERRLQITEPTNGPAKPVNPINPNPSGEEPNF